MLMRMLHDPSSHSAHQDPFEAKRRALGMPPTLSKKDAAAFALVGVRTIDRAAESGRLRTARSQSAGSSRMVILARDLLEYLGIRDDAIDAVDQTESKRSGTERARGPQRR